MKRPLILFAILVLAATAFAQAGGVLNGSRGIPVSNDTSTGTQLNGTAIIDSVGKAISATTSNTAVPTYIVTGGAGTAGNATLAVSGIAPCLMDITIGSGGGGYYVINSTTVANECHPQMAAPASGIWVIGFLWAQATSSGQTANVVVSNFFYGGSGGGTVTGSGTATFLPEWTSSTALGNSPLSDNGTTVSSSEPFFFGGNITVNGCTAGQVVLGDGTGCLTVGGSGTVTSLTFNAPLSGGTITTSGTVGITGAAGEILAGATPAFTATPILGVAGTTVGTLGFRNATSGTITLSPPTGALGAPTITLPSASGTLCTTATCTGAVSSVSNSDSTLTITPTTGAVVGSLNLGHANTWTALQTFGSHISIGGVTATGATGTGNIVFSASPTFSGTPAGPNGNLTQTIASGTAALGTSAIASGACASVVTVSASGVLTTDNIMADFNADPTSTVGYQPSTSGSLTIFKYPTANNVNLKVCNLTGSSITPGAIILNFRVVR
jgi:hypothetical protein